MQRSLIALLLKASVCLRAEIKGDLEGNAKFCKVNESVGKLTGTGRTAYEG